MNKVANPTCLGVLGGMGPMAGAQFLARLTALTPATRDQDHIPVLLWSNPRIPDRSAAMLSGGASPLPDMMQGMAKLQEAGADCIVIPCNTAHLWYSQLKENCQIPVLHIVNAVLADLRARGMEQGTIGLLGTPATLAMELYQPILKQAGYDLIVPAADGPIMQDCINAIAAVKGNRIDRAYTYAASAVQAMIDAGSQAVVLGCTELPVAIPSHRHEQFSCLLTDSIDALARQVLAVFWLNFLSPQVVSPTYP